MCPSTNTLKINKNASIPEAECKFIFKEILSAILYCHNKNMAHRDVKLENIIVTNEKMDVRDTSLPIKGIKVIDFGFAVKYGKSDRANMY